MAALHTAGVGVSTTTTRVPLRLPQAMDQHRFALGRAGWGTRTRGDGGRQDSIGGGRGATTLRGNRPAAALQGCRLKQAGAPSRC